MVFAVAITKDTVNPLFQDMVDDWGSEVDIAEYYNLLHFYGVDFLQDTIVLGDGKNFTVFAKG